MDKVLLSTGKDDWETPQWLFDKLNEKYHFNLDAAATDANHKCENYFTEEDNALTQDWSRFGVVFCNPPYSKKANQDAWVKKCFEEAKKGTLVVALLPARTDTKRFHDYCLGKASIYFIEGRLHFEQNGVALGPSTFPSMICVWDKTCIPTVGKF